MRRVAEQANVAISSVSRVLSGHPDVSESMHRRVMAAVTELGYEPHFLAQSLRRGRTLSVGFVLGDIANPLLAEVVQGAETQLRDAGLSLLLMCSGSDPDLDGRSVRFFSTRRVDGMLLSIVDETNEDLIEALAGVTVPVVLVDRALEGALTASSVVSDHRSGMRDAVAHLISLGHRQIALIGGPMGTLPAREREAGLSEAVRASGQHIEVDVLDGPFSREHGAEATSRLLDRSKPPGAIICGSNQVLVGCLPILDQRGITVGRDLSLVTCDDVPASMVYRPAIASISRDMVGLGRTAAELLLKRLETSSDVKRIVLATHFTPRESCAAPPASQDGR